MEATVGKLGNLVTQATLVFPVESQDKYMCEGSLGGKHWGLLLKFISGMKEAEKSQDLQKIEIGNIRKAPTVKSSPNQGRDYRELIV